MIAWSGNLADENTERERVGKLYREFLRVPAMSAGIYVLPVGAVDSQKPHAEDELYYVVRGKGRFRAAEEDSEVSAGALLFVAAQVQHEFYNISEQLEVLVFFAPAESI